MAARVRRLVSKPERLKSEQAEFALEVLQPLKDELPDVWRRLTAHVQQQTAARNGWTFIMISDDQNRAVVGWLRANSARPMDAMNLWSVLFTAVDRETGEVMLTRDQLAEMAGIAAQNVSNVMTELEGIDAIIKRRERVPGMRGPGMVRYFMNPLVGTHLPGGLRDAAQAEATPGPMARIAMQAVRGKSLRVVK